MPGRDPPPRQLGPASASLLHGSASLPCTELSRRAVELYACQREARMSFDAAVAFLGRRSTVIINYATDICWVPTVSGTVLAPGVGPPGSPGDKILGNVTHGEQAIQTASERGAPGCGRIPGHWAEGSRGRPATATQKEVTPEQDQVRGQGEPAGRGRARKGQACARTPHSTTRGAQRAWVSFFADCCSKSVEKRSGGELIRASTWGQ